MVTGRGARCGGCERGGGLAARHRSTNAALVQEGREIVGVFLVPEPTSPEGEAIPLRAAAEELDLEAALVYWTGLADELIQALVD